MVAPGCDNGVLHATNELHYDCLDRFDRVHGDGRSSDNEIANSIFTSDKEANTFSSSGNFLAGRYPLDSDRTTVVEVIKALPLKGGDRLVVGRSSPGYSTSLHWDSFVARLSVSGVLVWVCPIGISKEFRLELSSGVEDSNGNIFLCGVGVQGGGKYNPPEKHQIVVFKMSRIGKLLWQKTYPVESESTYSVLNVSSCVVAKGGNLVVEYEETDGHSADNAEWKESHPVLMSISPVGECMWRNAIRFNDGQPRIRGLYIASMQNSDIMLVTMHSDAANDGNGSVGFTFFFKRRKAVGKPHLST